MEGEDNVALELPSTAPGNVAPTLTMIGSVQLESYVTIRSPPTLVPKGTLVTVDTGPERGRANSGPHYNQYSRQGNLAIALGTYRLALDLEAVASTELCANLASGLTMVTSVTTELAVGTVASGLTAELATGIGEEEPKFTFVDRSEIWA